MSSFAKLIISYKHRVACLFIPVLFLIGSNAHADLIIKSGATLTVSNSSILDVNCTDIDLQANGTFNLTSATLEDQLVFNNNGTFNNSGGIIFDCLSRLAKQYSPNVISVGQTSQITYTITNDNSTVVNNLAFSDTFDQQAPLGELVVATPANVTNSCGGVFNADSGDTSASLSGGSLAGNSECTISVAVTSNVADLYADSTTDLSSDAGSGNAAQASLEVVTVPSGTPPLFSKTFAPASIGPGSISTLTFNIDNGTSAFVTGLTYTDNLPAGMTIASPANVSANCIANEDSVLSAPNGGSTISVSDYAVLPQSSCQINVDVTSVAVGTLTNTSGDLTSVFGNSGIATANLAVVANLPGVSAVFTPNTTSIGNRSTLTYTLDNTQNASRVGSVDFSTNLPNGLVIASPANVSNTCGSANATVTTTAVSGSDVFIFDADGNTFFPGFETLDAGESCTVSVDVVANAFGTVDVISNDVLSDFVTVGRASASLDVTRTDIAISKSFIDDPVSSGSTVTLEYRINNFNRSLTATDIAFSDNLTSALSGLTFVELVSNDCGGSVTGLGTGTIGLSGGTLSAGGSCAIRTTLVLSSSSPIGQFVSTTSLITASFGGLTQNGNAASDVLVVSSAPRLNRQFSTSVTTPGDSLTADFTITNLSTSTAATEIEFTEIIDPILSVTSTLPIADCCGSGSTCTLVFPTIDQRQLLVTNGNLGAGESCSFSLNLSVAQDAATGNYPTTTSQISAIVDGITQLGSAATDALTVVAAPSLSVNFTDDPVAPGSSVTLEFTLENSADAVTDATDISFINDLATVAPGLVASLPVLPDPPCGVGSALTGSAGNTLLTLAGGTLAPGTSCTFAVSLDVPANATAGTFTNTTSDVSATVNGVAVTSQSVTDELQISGIRFSKEFIDDPVIAGETTTLRYTIDNIHPTDDATITSFTDNLTGALSGLAATGGSTTDTCGGTLSGTMFLFYVGGSVSSGESCTIEVPVLVPLTSLDDSFSSATSALSAMQSGGSLVVNPARDNLEVRSSLLSVTKEFIDDPVLPGSTTTLEFVITNLDTERIASSVAFTDNLDATLSGLTFDEILSNSCASATVNGLNTGSLGYINSSLAPSESCTVQVSLPIPASTEAGTFTNTTSIIAGTINGFAVNGPAATDSLIVQNQTVNFSKSFGVGAVLAGETTTLSYVIENSSATASINNLRFTDNLDGVISGLSAVGVPTIDGCGSEPTINGSAILSVNNIGLAPNGSCTITVEISVPTTAPTGVFNSTSSSLMLLGAQFAGSASAELTVAMPVPLFSKVFMPNAIEIEDTSRLQFLVDNTGSDFNVTSLSFTDNLPANVQLAPNPNATMTCIGGTLTAVGGASIVSYSGGSVNNAASCTISVDVMATIGGVFVSTSSNLTSSAGSSSPASATLIVDDDRDDDGIVNAEDNCPNDGNADQADLDGDDLGDVCDLDDDGDSVPDTTDNCPVDDNGDQADLDGDDLGDVCDLDDDGDSVPDTTDNCPVDDNGDQADLDGDNLGDVCDLDDDGDLVPDTTDNCPVDNNSDQSDLDGDDIGDVCDSDIDGDSIPNAGDNCPINSNNNQADLDGDGQGNACDLDDDGDGLPDAYEIANGLDPLNSFDQQADPDGDGFTNIEEFMFGTDPNVPNRDDDDNGIPDIVDQRRVIIVPSIILPILLD